jgi:hypothetical protein
MKISNQSIQAISSGRSRPGRCFEKVVYNFDLYNSEKYTSSVYTSGLYNFSLYKSEKYTS